MLVKVKRLLQQMLSGKIRGLIRRLTYEPNVLKHELHKYRNYTLYE